MGTLLKVTCRDCGAESEQVYGAVILGFNPRCDRCGRTTFVEVRELVASDPPGFDPHAADAWLRREERIPALAGPCDCGGSFSEDAPLRCLSCRSRNVGYVRVGYVD